MIDRVVISHKCCGTCGKILVAGYLDQSIASSSVLFPLPLSLSLYIYIYVCVCVSVCVCVCVCVAFPLHFYSLQPFPSVRAPPLSARL